MENNPHYFWAISIPDEVKQYIHEELLKRKGIFPFKRWVHQQDYHITLAFLGAADKEKLELTVDLVGDTIKDAQAFPLSLKELGVFGKIQSPRIFWAGVNGEPGLFNVQSLVFQACRQAGFSLETRPFKPHITLARNWDGPLFNKELVEIHDPFKHPPVSFLVSEVVLYRTHLQSIPKYETITNFLLKAE